MKIGEGQAQLGGLSIDGGNKDTVSWWRSNWRRCATSSLAFWRRRKFVTLLALTLALATIHFMMIYLQVNHPRLRLMTADIEAEEPQICEMWTTMVSMTKSCLNDNFDTDRMRQPDLFWNEMDRLLDRCSVVVRDPLRLKILDDVDYLVDHMKFAEAKYERSCVSVSVGIANVSQEQNLKTLYPKCEMFAADPDRRRGDLFKTQFAGKYYPFAISANRPDVKPKDKLRKHRRWDDDPPNAKENLKPIGNRAKNVSPTMLEFVAFLRRKKIGSIIDFMHINAKGLEYRLMPYFYRGGALEKEGISVCQLNMVIHGHPEKLGIGNTYDWRNIIVEFFDSSDFLPVWSEKDWPNLKMTFINHADPRCYERFYRTAC